MTTSNLQNVIKNAAHRLARALEDAQEIKIETRYVLTDAPPEESGEESGNDNGMLVGRTIMQLDGDAELIVPMQRDDAGRLTADRELFSLHMTNVKSALEYRSELLSSLMRMLSQL